MERVVRFTEGEPAWPAVAAELKAVGEQPVLRMIDNQPAFPDEEPEAGWQELRVSVTGGMVTVRRGPDVWRCVVWGNADADLRRGWDAVCGAVARAGRGTVDGTAG